MSMVGITMNNFNIALLLTAIIFITGCKSNMKNENNISLPEYVTLNVQTLNSSEDKTIRIKAKTLDFPLSAEDLRDISILEKNMIKKKIVQDLPHRK